MVNCPACNKRKFGKKENNDGTYHYECRYCGYKTNRIYPKSNDDDNWGLIEKLTKRLLR